MDHHHHHLSHKIEHLKVLVFDLDYTLWPFWVDTHVGGFHLRDDDQKVYDRDRRHVTAFQEVPAVLDKLKSLGYELAIASRTEAVKQAHELVRLFNWERYFEYKEIYPGSKTQHIAQICEKSGSSFNEVIFFDDEHRNIWDLNSVQVCSVLVENGVNFDVISKGIQRFLEMNPKY